jgi:hypothetical protein
LALHKRRAPFLRREHYRTRRHRRLAQGRCRRREDRALMPEDRRQLSIVLDLFVEFGAFVAHGIFAFARIKQSWWSAPCFTRELGNSSIFCSELGRTPKSFDLGRRASFRSIGPRQLTGYFLLPLALLVACSGEQGSAGPSGPQGGAGRGSASKNASNPAAAARKWS